MVTFILDRKKLFVERKQHRKSLDTNSLNFILRNFSETVHEIPVDSFVYENCSLNIDTQTEFCAASPLTWGKVANLKLRDGIFQVVCEILVCEILV